MWNCPKCRAEVDDGFEVCWSCGTSSDGTVDPSFQAETEAAFTPALAAEGEVGSVGSSPSSAVLTEAPPVEPGAKPPSECVAPAPLFPEPDPSLSPQEYLRVLVNQLSTLIDSWDVPGWTINPAFHPDVAAFVKKHSNNSAFLTKAQALQKNRASYFATMRARALAPKPVEPEQAETAETVEEGPKPELEMPAPMAETPAVAPGWSVPLPSGRWLRRWLKRLLKICGVLLLLLFALAYVGRQYWKKIGEDRLAAAIAEADRLDPGWRWEELQAKRAAVPDDRNAALHVSRVRKMLPDDWTKKAVFETIRFDTEPNISLDDETAEQLQLALKKHELALKEAGNLTNYRTGRYPTQELREYLAGPIPLIKGLEVVGFMHVQVALQGARGHADDAVRSAHCALVAARSNGDEPDLLQFVFRVGSVYLAKDCLERALGQGQASDEALVGFQQLLQEELADKDMLLRAMRGERARQEQIWTAFAANDRSQFPPEMQQAIAEWFPENVWGHVAHWFLLGGIKENHAVSLELMNRLVEVARLPVEEQFEKHNQVRNEFEQTKLRTYREIPGKMASSGAIPAVGTFVQSHAGMRCTLAAIAVERYRLSNGDWPESLDQLTPAFLPEVPRDPYDGKPLRYRRLDDGVVIYSIGRDCEDNGGSLYWGKEPASGSDRGFRLWDVAHRRKPPMSPDEKAEPRTK